MWSPTNRENEWTATLAGLDVLARRQPDYMVTEFGDARYIAHGFKLGTADHVITVGADTLEGIVKALEA